MLERAAKAAKSHLESDLPAALDTQETYWTAAGDAVSLGDVSTWLFGHNPTVQERPRTDFPIVTVMAFEADPAEGSAMRSDQYGFGEEAIKVTINWFVAEDTEEDCNKMCLRYGEAIKTVMRDHRQLESNVTLDAYVPQTRVSLVARERAALAADEFYTQLGQQTWDVRARA